MRLPILRGTIPVLATLLFCSPPHAPAQSSKENADFKLALNLFNDGLYDLAAEQLRQFIAAYPGTSQGTEARFLLGRAQMKLGRFEEARATFQSFALTYQDHPRAPEGWWNVGECFAAVKNFREAALAFERVKVFHPKSTLAPGALVEAGRFFIRAGGSDDARRVYRIVLQEYGASGAAAAARTGLGELYFAEGNLVQARAELKRVVEGDPSPEARGQALLILGSIARSTGSAEEAARLFREILDRHAESTAAGAARVGLARILAGQGRDREALDHLRKVLEARTPPDSTLLREALVAAGDAAAALRDYAAAVRHYNAFFAAFPGDSLFPHVLWKSARVNSTARNHRRSSELCAQILTSGAPAPLRRRAMIQLALNASAEGNSARALQVYQSFVEQYPDHPAAPAVLLRAAQLSAALGDLRKAALTYEAVVDRYPQAAPADDALAAAAAAYADLRDPDRALQLYRRLVSAFPASPLRPAAERRVRDIEIFEAKNKDAGLEKLALLLGDVVAQRDREGLPYRLGEVYFHDLKSYAAAAEQFTAAVTGGWSDPRLVDARFLRARSYEYLAERDAAYRAQAVAAYEEFLSASGSDDRAPEAASALFFLTAETPAAARTTFDRAMETGAGRSRRDTLLLGLGVVQMAGDSTREAIATLTTLVREYPAAPSAAEGRYRRYLCFTTLGLADSALAAGREYLGAEPRGARVAEMLDALGAGALARAAAADAQEFFRRLAEEFPYTPAGEGALRKSAEAAAAAGDRTTAVSLYRNLFAAHEDDPLSPPGADAELSLGLSQALMLAGNPAEARSTLLGFLEQRPPTADAARALNLLGMIARAEGSLDQAASYFRQAAAAAPDAPPSREVADLLYEGGSHGEALRQYRRLAAAAGDAAEQRHCEARIILSLLKTNDLPGAEKEIAAFAGKHRDADEELAAFELERGQALLRREDVAGARKSFDRVAEKYDETASAPAALYWIGKLMETAGKQQDAVKHYEALIRKHPDAAILPRVHLALGNLFYQAEKWDSAVRSYRKIVDDPAADPELLPPAMGNLIETYETAGVFDAALALTRRYLERYPDSDDSFDKQIKIGILYQRLGYFEQSALHLQSLLEQAGSDLEGEIRFYIGEAHFGKGDYQQAILEFLKVPYLVTKRGKIDWAATSLYMSGQSYEKLGRHDQALGMYRQILERPGIDETFRAAARKEIERVRTVLKDAKP